MVLIFSAILTGCGTTRTYTDPLCVPGQPVLAALSVEEQQMIRDYDEDLLFRIADNQMLLTDHIWLLNRLIRVHNEQFEATCP